MPGSPPVDHGYFTSAPYPNGSTRGPSDVIIRGAEKNVTTPVPFQTSGKRPQNNMTLNRDMNTNYGASNISPSALSGQPVVGTGGSQGAITSFQKFYSNERIFVPQTPNGNSENTTPGQPIYMPLGTEIRYVP